MTDQLAPLAPETLDLLKGVSSATVTTQLLKNHGMRTRSIRGVQPISPDRCRFVGPAFTMRYVPVREDLIPTGSLANPDNPMRQAVETIPAGSVLVMDMQADPNCGALGEILVARLIYRGVAGAVADGAMRDVTPIGAMALPVFCNGYAPPPSFATLLIADIQRVIGCGGVMVWPGDIVVGDPDGVVVIPRHLAGTVAKAGAEQERVEAWIRRRVEAGAPIPGTYPPNEATLAEYRKWVEAGEPMTA